MGVRADQKERAERMLLNVCDLVFAERPWWESRRKALDYARKNDMIADDDYWFIRKHGEALL